jgi:hypothetical protein
MKKRSVFIFILLIYTLNVSSQSISNGSVNKLFFEKTYLHTDREVYIGGETLWFSAYLINAQNNQFINSSNTLYVELVSTSEKKETEVIDKKIIRMEQGKGAGDFKLKDSIAAGTYSLRAWTNWMRNFNDNFLFEKEITVLNSFEIAEETIKAKKKSGIKTTPTLPVTTILLTKENIQFFPEGGSMIDSIASIVAFKAVDANGKSLGVEGEISDKNGTVINKFSDKMGLGIFLLQPEKDQLYIAKGSFSNGQKFNTFLPKALSKGYSIRVIDKDSILNVYITLNNATPRDGKEILITGKSKGKTCFSIQFAVEDSQNLVQIPKKNFPEGIAAITLYDDKGRPNCERLVFINHNKLSKIIITADKQIYKPKEKVTLNIKSLDSKNNPVSAAISLAALDYNLTLQNKMNIISYLMLESELKGKIENPTQYFDLNNGNREKQLDLLLLTQGWRDFLWRRLAEENLKITNVAEQGITISGRLRQIFSDKPIAKANISMFVNNAKGTKLFGSTTDSSGIYNLDGLEIYGSQTIKLTAADNKGKKSGYLQLDSLFKVATYSKKRLKLLDTTVYYKKIAEEMVARRKKKYNITDTIKLAEVKINANKNTVLFNDVATSFGYPEESFTVTSADYDFQNLGNYLLYKSKQAIEKSDESDPGRIRIGFPFFGEFYQPLIIVNGKELAFSAEDSQDVKDTYYDTYFNIGMNMVEKVVVKHLVGANKLSLGIESGMSEISGIRDVFVLYLTLKPNALENRKFNIIHEQVEGYYQTRLFYIPNSGNSKNPNPNITLYWNPNIITDKNGESQVVFYNSDIKSKVRITAEGLTTSGSALLSNTFIEVK